MITLTIKLVRYMSSFPTLGVLSACVWLVSVGCKNQESSAGSKPRGNPHPKSTQHHASDAVDASDNQTSPPKTHSAFDPGELAHEYEKAWEGKTILVEKFKSWGVKERTCIRFSRQAGLCKFQEQRPDLATKNKVGEITVGACIMQATKQRLGIYCDASKSKSCPPAMVNGLPGKLIVFSRNNKQNLVGKSFDKLTIPSDIVQGDRDEWSIVAADSCFK